MNDINLPPLPAADCRTDYHHDGCGFAAYSNDQMFAYATAAVLADRERRGKPVGWRFKFPTSKRWHFTEHGPHEATKAGLEFQRLYAAPQPVEQRKPLTDEQIETIVGFPNDGVAAGVYYRIVRAVEAAHGIGKVAT